jgi:outer membrane protein TolC
MNDKRIFILAILCCFSLAGFSQEIKQLTLQEAIELSLKNSKQLKISQARIDEALAQAEEAKQARLPDLKISGSYLRLNSAKIDLKSASDSGGSYGGGPKVNQAIYGMANLSFPVYAGGRIRYGIESAKYLAEAAKLDAESDASDIIFNTTRAYVNLYKAYESVILVNENLNSSLSRDSNFSNLEKNGLLARNDLLKAQLQTSNVELALLTAENDFRIATVNMNLMLGLPETDSLVVDTAFVERLAEAGNFMDYQNAALQNRMDIKATNLRKKAAEVNIKSARAEAYPTLALTGGYVAADIPKFLTITNALNIGVGVQYNLASLWKKNTKLQQARARDREISATREMLNDEVKLDINRDYQNYLLSLKRIELFEKSLVQANENFRITNNKYNNSLVTLTDLLDADVERLQAKINIATAKADAVLAYNQLLKTSGLLQTGK